MINLMIGDYNFYFFSLTEYHAYIIRQIPQREKLKIVAVSQRTFLNLQNNNPDHFDRGLEYEYNEA